VLDWESQESFQAGLASSEGEAALADLPNFAGAGVTMLTGPANEI